jgi:hypothetical protein
MTDNRYMFTQFSDLTEVYTTSLRDYTEANLHDMVQTEFLFGTTTKWQNSHKFCKQLGFKAVSCMNNWWPTHDGDNRTMTLWWKRLREKQDAPLEPQPCHWGMNAEKYGIHERHTQASGCGFKIAEPPLRRNLFFRYHTLLRLPIDPNRIRRKWLEKHHFWLLEVGSFASFWVNGWKPEEYDWLTVEVPFWKQRGISLDATKSIAVVEAPLGGLNPGELAR